MFCSYCGQAGAGVRLLPTASVCGKASCEDAARFVDEVYQDEPELAESLQLEPVVLNA